MSFSYETVTLPAPKCLRWHWQYPKLCTAKITVKKKRIKPGSRVETFHQNIQKIWSVSMFMSQSYDIRCHPLDLVPVSAVGFSIDCGISWSYSPPFMKIMLSPLLHVGQGHSRRTNVPVQNMSHLAFPDFDFTQGQFNETTWRVRFKDCDIYIFVVCSIGLFNEAFCFVLFDLILYVHSTIFQLCGTGLPGLNQY